VKLRQYPICHTGSAEMEANKFWQSQESPCVARHWGICCTPSL